MIHTKIKSFFQSLFWCVIWFFGDFILWIILSMLYFAPHPSSQIYTLPQIEKKWGHQEFNTQKFKEGLPYQRASMVVDLIEKKLYLGQSIDQVHTDLGQEDTKHQRSKAFTQTMHYYTLKFPEQYWLRNAEEILGFEVDPQTQKVSKVDVYKKCCDNPHARNLYRLGLINVE